MNRLIAFLLIALLPSFALAQVTGEVGASYVSAYTFRGQKVAGASIQPTLQLGSGNAYVTVWGNQPTNRDEDSEVDFTAGYSAEAKEFGVDGGVTAYHYPQSRETTWEPFVTVKRDVEGFTPSISAFRDWTLHTTTWQTGLSYAIELGKRLTLTPRANTGIVRGGDHYTYWEGALEASYAVSETIKATVGVAHTSSDAPDVGRNITSVTVGFRATF